MPNKRSRFAVILLSLMGTITAFAQSNYVNLVLKSGETITFTLEEKPQFSYGATTVTWKTTAMSVEYNMSDIDKITLGKKDEPVVDPVVDPVDPVDPVVDPEEPVVDPVDPVVDPEEPVVDPKDPEEEISTGVIELAKNDVDSKSINGRNGIIHFSGFKAGSKVEVFNISGKAIESHIIPQDGTLDINISSYPSGNYIFKANTLTYKINKK